MMPPSERGVDRWRTLLEIFDTAAEMAPAERRAYVESISHSSDIQREVLELLEKLESPDVPDFPAPIGKDANSANASACIVDLKLWYLRH